MNKLLIIESDEILRKTAATVLSEGGNKVEEASDGKEGFRLALEREYDLIICDTRPAKKDGYELVREIKKHPMKQIVPFVMITDKADIREIRSGLNIGVDHYIIKPFSAQDLLGAVNACLAKKAHIAGYYENKYKNMVMIEKKFFFNSLTRLPNQHLLLKNIEDMIPLLKEKLRFFIISFSIDGYDDICTIVNRQILQELLKQIVRKVQGYLYESEELYQCSDNDFIIVSYVHLLDNREVIDDEYFIGRTQAFIEMIKSPFQLAKYEMSLTTSVGTAFCDNIEAIDDVTTGMESARYAKRFVELSGGNDYAAYSQNVKKKLANILSPSLKKHFFIREIKRKDVDEAIEEDDGDVYECKVFFLYPHNIIQEKLIVEIVKNEYQAYIINDHKKLPSILAKYRSSVLFINLDAVLPEKKWEVYIRNLMTDKKTAGVRIGILTFYGTADMAKKYLLEARIQCGFIRLRTSYAQCKDIIIKALEAVEAKGKRKYIRIDCRGMPSVSVSLKISEQVHKGVLHDISSVGMACRFGKDLSEYLEGKKLLEDIQLHLKGKICSLKGEIVGKRYTIDREPVYIIMFGAYIESAVRDKIYQFIYESLQKEIDAELA
ncbi:MAG: response regulator [Spirochaetales bacterium]|nr:response regulator [Spirochaetales bacterium]